MRTHISRPNGVNAIVASVMWYPFVVRMRVQSTSRAAHNQAEISVEDGKSSASMVAALQSPPLTSQADLARTRLCLSSFAWLNTE
jgi:hypothetical protein